MGKSPSGRSVAVPSSLSTMHWLASDIYKADVYDNAEDKIGTVTDLIVDNNGNVTTAVVSVGGLLGVGAKDVAVPFKELKVTSRDGKDWLVLHRDEVRDGRERLEAQLGEPCEQALAPDAGLSGPSRDLALSPRLTRAASCAGWLASKAYFALFSATATVQGRRTPADAQPGQPVDLRERAQHDDAAIGEQVLAQTVGGADR